MFNSTKANKIYAHVVYPPGDELCAANIKNIVTKVYYLDTREPLPFSQENRRVSTSLAKVSNLRKAATNP